MANRRNRSIDMNIKLLEGLLIPFLGTSLGSACVFFMSRQIRSNLQRALTGFAAGVMIAASIWSLILPALEQSADYGKWSFFPALTGLWCGIGFLLLVDSITPHLHWDTGETEGVKSHLSRTTMMILAVAIHNAPEGMAVGVVYSGWLSGQSNISYMGALALAIGIAVQNFPEGAIVSMPLCSEGASKKKAFILGVLSGAVEPLAALLTIFLSSILIPALPYLLGFAAGAMIYVVVEELIPEMSEGAHSNIGSIMFAVGFSLMMILDVALG